MKEKIKFITFTQVAMISSTYKVLLERRGDQKRRKRFLTLFSPFLNVFDV